jgi:cell division protein FtsN
MLFGLGLGLIVAVGVYLRAPSGTRAAPPADTKAAAERPAARPSSRPAAATTDRAAPPENRFSFYDVLPQVEVAVGDDDNAHTSANAHRRPAETPGSYLLQAGSFSTVAEADRMQANLALLGFESHVQRVTLDDDVFNRVRIGPIVDIDAAKRTQRQLRAAGYDTLLMQVPK